MSKPVWAQDCFTKGYDVAFLMTYCFTLLKPRTYFLSVSNFAKRNLNGEDKRRKKTTLDLLIIAHTFYRNSSFWPFSGHQNLKITFIANVICWNYSNPNENWPSTLQERGDTYYLFLPCYVWPRSVYRMVQK